MDFLFLSISFQQFVNLRKLCFRKFNNPLPKFLIEFFFYPRYLFPLFPDTIPCSGETYFQRIIQKKNRIAEFKPHLYCSAIIAINDPTVCTQDIH